MSKAIVLDKSMKASSEIEVPAEFSEINPHNLYLYVKSYKAALRSNTARAKTRAEVRGGGKKPWAQKGRGGARAGSSRSPVWVGGGKAFGPTERNYTIKVNKKQKKLAFDYAIAEKANNNKLYIVDSVNLESGKTKDAIAFIGSVAARDVLVVTENFTEKTYLAFRNIANCYLVEAHEVNPFLLTAYDAVIIEKDVFTKMIER
jgi:large subunit ribosomal protein L4